METLILSASAEDLQRAAQLLRTGETVVFPTETVYGLGADGLNPGAVAKIFEAKGRPQDNPLILHIADRAGYTRIVRSLPPKAQQLIERFCPGPLTLVLPKTELVPDAVTAGLDSVAVRMPSSAIARQLIRLAGVPIAAPSANISGRPSPTCARDVIEDLQGKVAAIVAADTVEIGLESTVVDCTVEPPKLLRPGGITVSMIENTIGKIQIDPSIDTYVQVSTPKSPGMKYKHYAPQAPMYVWEGLSDEQLLAEINLLAGQNVGVLLRASLAEQLANKPREMIVWQDLKDLAKNLFSALREFDRREVKTIYAQGVEPTGLGLAIMNRMRKSAGFKIIYGK